MKPVLHIYAKDFILPLPQDNAVAQTLCHDTLYTSQLIVTLHQYVAFLFVMC